MSIPHAVICHIAERNASIEELDRLIGLLQEQNHFRVLGGPAFDSDKNHLGTTLAKSVTGDSVNDVFDVVQNELEDIETQGTVRFACRLTVAAKEAISEGIFIT